jgi:nicotinamide-nucleotide amidase
MSDRDATVEELAESIAERASASDAHVAVAESLTSGKVAEALGAASDASSWFSGAVVAYESEIKYSLLGVDRGPVATERCARQMAIGVASLMHVDISAAVTGVGGPGPQDGVAAGTVWIAVNVGGSVGCAQHQIDGDPTAVVGEAARLVLLELDTAMRLRRDDLPGRGAGTTELAAGQGDKRGQR